MLRLVLDAARSAGRSSDYLQQKIWQPIGAEADATWLVDRAGQEATFCCLNAVLRDYARLGLLLAHDGNWRGRQIIPAAWIRDATTVRPDQPHSGAAHRDAVLRLRLSDLDLARTWMARRIAGCSRSGHTRPGDLRRSVRAGWSWSTPPCASCRSIRPARRTVALWRGVVRDLGR